MTVAELIEALKAMPQDLHVCTDYEGFIVPVTGGAEIINPKERDAFGELNEPLGETAVLIG